MTSQIVLLCHKQGKWISKWITRFLFHKCLYRWMYLYSLVHCEVSWSDKKNTWSWSSQYSRSRKHQNHCQKHLGFSENIVLSCKWPHFKVSFQLLFQSHKCSVACLIKLCYVYMLHSKLEWLFLTGLYSKATFLALPANITQGHTSLLH